ncbi:MAG: hypothetical protein Q9184_004550 [Pyrenodesmia sp. 2 TL-2023]
MAPPEPTYQFCIPSLYDDTSLDCRVYSLPKIETEKELTGPWVPRGAIVAHPWTTLGGSYDDTTVLHAVAALVERGLTVGIFNFRGVRKPKGDTWTGRLGNVDLQDYVSFVAFFIFYLANVYPPSSEDYSCDKDLPLRPVISDGPAVRFPFHLIVAGYSYGALLTRYLPLPNVILSRFSQVLRTSTEAEIRLRADKLAVMTRVDILSYLAYGSQLSGSLNGHAVLLDSRLEDWSAIQKAHMGYLEKPFVRQEKDSWPGQRKGQSPTRNDFLAIVYVPPPKMHHLLISLPLWPTAAVLTGFKKLKGDVVREKTDQKLARDPTLLIHGKRDWFSPYILIKAWKSIKFPTSQERLQIVPLERAGHSFAGNNQAVDTMKLAIKVWIKLGIEAED